MFSTEIRGASKGTRVRQNRENNKKLIKKNNKNKYEGNADVRIVKGD